MPISRRGLLTGTAAALLAAGAAGCADRTGPDQDAAALARLLDRRARAVLRRDRAALAATVLPGATALRTRQLAWLDNLAQVPLAAWEYRLQALDAYPLPAALGSAGSGGRRRAARVHLRYRLAGFDTEPVTATAYQTFERIGGAWYLGSDTDHPGGDVQLWDLGPVTVVHGRCCLVLGLGSAAALPPYARLADRAVPAVSAVWGDGWGRRTVLLVPSTTQQFGSLLGVDPQGFAGTAAVTSGEYGAAEAGRTERITVNPPVWAQLTALGRQVVTTHETTHVATRAVTDTWTPRWLAEGAANWTGYLGTGLGPRQICPELQAAVAAGHLPGQLPPDSAFDGTAPDLAQTYEQAWFACRTIVLRHGQAGLVGFYRALAATGGSGGQQAAVEQALRRSLGTGTAVLTAQWRADLLAALR
ncbi:hypothetical protein GXW83_09080 [Streptacidiphilus sp. PB12-B1b]|uniref:hypothetical protein n=1 Tax=Streptacidiphilus sp. PB12-B1b TaxID=2705012 RepID=UPI0015FE69E1|nr:hypothetical protein [Streptacidiphilus sp. PB12-B1b]QMU75871.1 hypothetical protein GXW83_09080 [Streptacidiphilus sp. PB12-B1b]